MHLLNKLNKNIFSSETIILKPKIETMLMEEEEEVMEPLHMVVVLIQEIMSPKEVSYLAIKSIFLFRQV